MYYNEFLMKNFLRGYKKYLNASDSNEYEYLLQNFFGVTSSDNAEKKSWNVFLHYCKELSEANIYSPIISFMYAVFTMPNKYDLQKFKEILSKITVVEGIDLATLCAEFYLEVKSCEYKDRWSKVEENKKMCKENDPYTQETTKTFYQNPVIRARMPLFILRKVLGINVGLHDIDKGFIDDLVGEVNKIQKDRLNKIISEYKEENKKSNDDEEECKKQGGDMHLQREIIPVFKTFDWQFLVPGTLLDLFKALELNGKNEYCYYILEKYVLEVFAVVPWSTSSQRDVKLMGVVFNDYMDAFYSLVLKDKNWMQATSFSKVYTQESFFQELMGTENGCIINSGKEEFSAHKLLGERLKSILDKGHTDFRKTMPEYLYSFLFSFVPYVLYCSGEVNEASQFITKYFNEISLKDRSKLYFQVTLVRCMLETEHLETINILNGYYNFEMDRLAREHENIYFDFQAIVDFLEEAKQALEDGNYYTYDTNESRYNILYSNGRIDKITSMVRESCKNNTQIEYTHYRELMKILEAYTYESGIRLGLLGLDNYENYDKFDNALPPKLREFGFGLMNKFNEFDAYMQSEKDSDLRRSVNVVVQKHLVSAIDKTINESIEHISRIREKIVLIDEVDNEKIMAQLEEVTENLGKRLYLVSADKYSIENEIDKLQKDFLKKYLPNEVELNLFDRVPLNIQQDIKTYIVTSRVVFKFLENRPDNIDLDFSPALISLTKAVEMLLNYAYSEMRLPEYEEVKDDLDKHLLDMFYKKPNRKSSLELGSCIFLLKDYKYINIKNENNRYKAIGNTKYLKSHFENWGGNDIFDFSIISKFSEISINVDIDKTRGKGALYFTEDKSYNRLVISKALEYLKNNYRNIVAHKDKVKASEAQECHELLLQTENLLWILLYCFKNHTDPCDF